MLFQELRSGATLLHYEVQEKIGEGGMGAVWRAHDSDLQRLVAIKVLPRAVAEDGDRLARFEREARLLATLNHPNVASIFGLHEADGVRFIAMELVDGEDLSDRIARGPVPIAEAIEIAASVAQALDAAHQRGVIHRDLKPANIRISSDNRVKVLDFGLARMEFDANADLSSSPTASYKGTAAGVILGTAAYMSPEQARGKTVDKRTDIWAFGCVLFEMLTGAKVFRGENLSDLLADVLRSEPAWSDLPTDLPRGVDRLLRRCLHKEPERRLRDIGDAWLELGDEALVDEPQAATRQGQRRFTTLGVALAAVVGFAIGALTWVIAESRSAAEPVDEVAVESLRGSFELSETARLAFGAAPLGYESPLLSISPDGQTLVTVGGNADGTWLFRRDLASFEDPQPIAGTEGALYAFFGSDPRTVAFLTENKLKRVKLNGDDLKVLASATESTRAAWTDDGWIYFAELEAYDLKRVSAGGGPVESVTKLTSIRVADVLPDGSGLLATRKTRGISADYAEVVWIDLESLEIKTLVQDGYDGRFLAPNHLLFARGGNLLAMAFDPRRGEVSGLATTVARDVAMDSMFDQAQVAVSRSGAVVFVPGADSARGQVAWFDLDGGSGLLPLEARVFGSLDLSADDRRLAIHVGDLRDSVVLFDLEKQQETAVSVPGEIGWPRWSRDGRRLAYSKLRSDGGRALVVYDVLQRNESERSVVDGPMLVQAWAPDDREILLNIGVYGVLSHRLDDSTDTIRLEDAGLVDIAPNGRWVAHSSSVSGVVEILVRGWPEGEPIHSVGEGIEPRWCANGDLFFRKGGTWFRVAMKHQTELSWSPPEQVFELAFLDTPGTSYDISSDGRRLYVVVQAQPDITDRIRFIADLSGELEVVNRN